MKKSDRKAEIGEIRISVGLLNLKILFLSLTAMFLLSCGSSKELIEWNVELKDSEVPMTDKCDPNKKLQSVKCIEKPKYLPATEQREARIRALGIPCEKNQDPTEYDIPVSRLKRITYVADPLEPPVSAPVNELSILDGCCRNRTGWWIFDKLELKLMLGYRGTKDSVIYPTATGQNIARSSFFGIDTGGSSMIFGFEAAALWNVPFIDKSKSFQLGVMTGVWPVDASIFIPLALHGRYTFNQFPAMYGESCNSWYLYGDIGMPLDFKTKAPIIGKTLASQRYFYGAGIGYDWAVTCSFDLSFDLGFRNMNLPLPPIECCPTLPADQRYPFRNSTALVFRFGITF